MKRRIIIVGAGISGLAAAFRLLELSRESAAQTEIIVLEASQRLGGVIATERIGDFLVEAGPDSFISEKPWALQLCERLGMSSRLTSTNPANQNLYIVSKGALQPLPAGFYLLAPTQVWPFVRTPIFSWLGKLRMAMEVVIPRRNLDGDESLASFVRRRFGPELLERVAQPLIGGIYAADPEKLSLAATMPRFLEMERSQGSVIRAMRREQRRRSHDRQRGSGRWSLFVTPAGGMHELVDAIATRFPPGAVRLNTKVTSLSRDEAKKTWRITDSRGEVVEASGAVLALPSYVSAAVLANAAPEITQELGSITYSSTATVSLAYPRKEISFQLDGFGFVVPAIEKRALMACTFSSIKYPARAPENQVLLRAFIGGQLQPELFEQDDAVLEKTVRAELALLMGVKAAPRFCRIFRYPRAMPQYKVGHLELLQRIETRLKDFPTLALAGNAYGGVGIADCVHSGEQAAERIFQSTS